MSFMSNVADELNVSVTENGALAYATTKRKLLDFNFKIATYRNRSEVEIRADFLEAWYENKELALKMLFFIRDVREGAGERRLFRVAIDTVMNQLPETQKLFDWVVEYGRWDDLFVFKDTKFETEMISYICAQLDSDLHDAAMDQPISLCAKWMPSINTSSTKTKALAKWFACEFDMTDKEYRKMLSFLRDHMKVVETRMCANKWSDIEYSQVPSLANMRYKDSFMRHDEDRRREYLEALSNGETKINASVLFPQDIVHQYCACFGRGRCSYEETYEQLWKNLPDYVQGNDNILVVRDGSGSMTWKQSGMNVYPIDISTALAIYFSERQSGEFRDTFITFSETPKLVSLKDFESLADKLNVIAKYNEYANTDFQAVMELVLDTAVHNNMKQEDLPSRLLVISDMEFDPIHPCDFKCDEKLMNHVADEYAARGYKMPGLVFWNVGGRTDSIPITQNELGLTLVSGFSPAIVKMVLSNELDPYKALTDVLNSERYSQVTFG